MQGRRGSVSTPSCLLVVPLSLTVAEVTTTASDSYAVCGQELALSIQLHLLICAAHYPSSPCLPPLQARLAPISVPLIDTVRVCVAGIKDTLIAGVTPLAVL
jgi:hypothetical protein